jgi:hypothetical protein
MDGGAAKVDYERESDIKNQKIRELEEKLAVFKLNINNAEKQLRKYTEEYVIRFSDDCDCRHQLSAVADLLKKIVVTERNARNSNPKATSRRNNKVDSEIQTEAKSRHRDRDRTDEKETMRLEAKNEMLTELVGYHRTVVVLNEEIERNFHTRLFSGQQSSSSRQHTFL